MPVDYIPTPGYINGELVVGNITHLDINKIGSDVASPIDTLAIHCDTTIGSASNGRDLYVYLDPAKQVVIDGSTQAQTQTGGAFYVAVTTAASLVKAMQIDLVTHNLGNTEWAFGLWIDPDVSAALTATSSMAAIYLVDPDDTADCDTYGLYVEAGYDWGIAVLSPVLLSSLVIAPIADPTPYPLDFALEGWPPGTGTAGVYSQGRVINMDYGVARTLDGALAGIYMDFNTNLTVAAQVVTGIYMDISTGDEANPSIGISIIKNVTADSATRAMTGSFIDLYATLASFTSGAGATWDDYFIDMDIDLIYNDTAVIFSGGFINMVLTAPADGLPQAYGDMVSLTMYSVILGNTLRGFYIDSDVRLNDAAAVHYGMEIDMTGVTLTNYLTEYGIFVQMQATYGAGADAAIYATGAGNQIGLLQDTYGIYLNVLSVAALASPMYFDLEVFPTGNVIEMVYTAAEGLSGALTGIDMDFSANVTMGANVVTGILMDISSTDDGNAAVGLNVTKDGGGALSAADQAISGNMITLASAVTNTTAGDFDVANTSNGISLTMSHVVNSGFATTDPDTFSGTAFIIDIDGTTTQANDELTMTARAVDISYTALQTLGTFILDVTDIFRIDFNVDAGVAIATGGAGDLNIMLLNGDGFVPGATFANNTDVHGIHMDWSSAALGADAQVQSFVGIRIDMPANYGADGGAGGGLAAGNTNAAIYATGNANIFSALIGDGVYVEMNEVGATVGIHVVNAANDTVGTTSQGILVAPTHTINHANAVYYGLDVDLTGMTLTGTTDGLYGVRIDVTGMTAALNTAALHLISGPTNFNTIWIDARTTDITGQSRLFQIDMDVANTGGTDVHCFYVDIDETVLGNSTLVGFNMFITAITGANTDITAVSISLDGDRDTGTGNLHGVYVDGGFTINHANEDFYGIEVDLNSVTVGAAGAKDFYGIYVDMNTMSLTGTPTNFAAMKMMLPAAGYGIWIDNATTDIVGAKDLIFLDMDIGDVGANQVRGLYMDIDETVAGTDATDIIGAQIDITGVTLGRADLIGMKMFFDGAKDGGDVSYGLLIDADQTIDNTAEFFYPVYVDMTGMTTTDGSIEGANILFPTGTIGNGLYWKGLDINADNVTCGVGEFFYGIHLDMESLTPGGTVYGMYVNVPGDGATGIYIQHDQAGAAATSYGVQVLESFATAAGEVFTKSGGAIQIGKTITNVGAGSSSTYSGDELTTTLTLTQDPAGQVLYSGSFVNLTIVPTNSPQIYGNKVTQQYGAVTVPDAQTLAGYHLSASATIGTTVAATANTYGTHLDLSACTSGAAAGAWIAEFYGVYVQMPGAGNNVWGGGKTAAIYAEGNGITSVILGEIGTNIAAFGVILPAAGPTAFYIDQITNDATTAKDIFFIDIDVGDIGANPLRGMYVSIDETVAGTDGAELIGYQVDITGVDTGRADLLGMQMVFDGEKSGGDETKGLYVDANLELDNAAEHFYGVHVDTTGLTLGAAAAAGTLNYGVFIEMPAAYGAATEAAIYATGNANIWSCLLGDGMYIQMGEDSSIFMNMDAPAAWTQGTILNFAWSAAVASLGGGVTGVALDLSTNVTDANDQTVVAMDITMPANVSATSYAISLTSIQDQGAGMFMDLNGTVGAGQTLRGVYIDSTGATCGLGETFYGIEIDMSGMGIAGTSHGMHMTVPTASRGIHIAHVLAADGDLIGTHGLYYDLTSGANTVGLMSAFTSDIDTTGATTANGVQSFIFSEDERQFTSWNNMSYYGIYHMATLGGGGDCYSVNGIDLSIYTDDLTINLTLGDSYLYALHIVVDETGTQSTVDYAYGLRLSLNASGDIRVDTAQYLISIDDAGTIQAGNTGYGYYHASSVTCGVGETYYAMNIDISGMTTGGTIRAMFLEMEATGAAIYIDNATVDVVGAKDLIYMDVDVGDVGANQVRGIFMDIDETVAGTNGTYIRGLQVDITGVTAGRADLEAIRIYYDGTKDGGDITCGLQIESDLTINNAGEYFYGICMNLNGMTVGAANATELCGLEIQMETMTLTGTPATFAAIRMLLPASGNAICIDQATTDVGAAGKDLIFADIDVDGLTGAAYFRGIYLDIDETAVGNDGSFIHGIQVDMTGFGGGRADLVGVKVVIDGSKTGGDLTDGMFVSLDVTVNNASECLCGYRVDATGITNTLAQLTCGMWVQDYTQLDYHALLQREDTGTDGPILGFYFDSSTVAVDDDIGIIEFRGRNAADNADLIYGQIMFTVSGIGAGAETSSFEVYTLDAGASNLAFYVDSTGVGFFDDVGAGTGLPTLFDAYNDPKLAYDLAHRDNMDHLADLGLVMRNPNDPDRFMIAVQPALQLAFGGIYQNRDYMDEQFGLLNTRFETLEDKVVRLEQENEDLKAMVVAMKET